VSRFRPPRLLTHCWAALLCAVLARAAATPPRVEVVEGDGAINNIRLHRAKEPMVRVVDSTGQPLPDVAVTFLLPESGASGTFADGLTSLTIMTDANGQAVGRGLHPNNHTGEFQIRVMASYQGEAVTAVVTQTNAEPVQAGGSSKKILIVALLGGAAAAGAAVLLAKGKTSSSGTTTTTSTGTVITPGAPTFGQP
jgi:hypothetical protein